MEFKDRFPREGINSSQAHPLKDFALLERLVASWPEAPFTFELALVEEEEPNAMALPGGAILLTSGLLETVDSENGLAFVLAHELGHYAHRDHLRSLSRGLALGAVMALVTGSGSAAAGDVVRFLDRSAIEDSAKARSPPPTSAVAASFPL